MATPANAPIYEAAPAVARRPGRRAALLGGLALALLDLLVYLAFVLGARPAPCSAPGVSTPALDCFWPELGASLATLPWVYLGLTLAVPLVVTVLAAARDPGAASGERGVVLGSMVGLLASALEALMVMGVIGYEVLAAAATPGAGRCPPGERCIDIAASPGLLQNLLVIAGLIVGGILFLRLLGGAALGALGGWLGRHRPGMRRQA